MNVPVIRIEIEGVREAIGHALCVHNDEFNTMIKQAVEKAFNFETIQEKIDREVEVALDNSIKTLSGDSLIRDALKCFVLNSIVKMNEQSLKRDHTDTETK